MKYLITGNSITIYLNGVPHLISSLSNSYFDLIKSKLLNNEEVSTWWLSTDEYLQQTTGGAFRYIKGEYFYNNEPIPNSIGKRVRELANEGIPYQPLVNFWNKLKGHTNPETVNNLAEQAGNQKIPLTWDGDLVLYTRASWLPSSLEETFDTSSPLNFRSLRKTDWSGDFEAGKLVQSTNNEFLPCGDFQWITQSCPDQGAIFDIQVHPCHVVNVKNPTNNLFSPNITVSQFRYLSRLQEQFSPPEKVCFINAETNNLGKLVVRRPYSDESLRAYLSSLIPGNNQMAQSNTVSVSMLGSC